MIRMSWELFRNHMDGDETSANSSSLSFAKDIMASV
jgi:hypothetical protein